MSSTEIRLPERYPKAVMTILDTPVCLYAVSKNMDGEILLDKKSTMLDTHNSRLGRCVSLRSVGFLGMTVVSHAACDSGPSRQALNGRFEARLAVSYFRAGDQRGYHSGTFVWRSSGIGDTARVTWRGNMSGITNAGTHRKCEDCDLLGHWEGRLNGRAVSGDDPFPGARILGSYVIGVDWNDVGADGVVDAALEGVIIAE